jgi:5'-methylthioadenosine phosphorylase
MPQAKIGVIGGTGLYDVDDLINIEEVIIQTPFGQPSDAFVIGDLKGTRVAFLPRHARGHRISPTEIPSRANIWGMKSLGVEHIIAINSVGSFREQIQPGHLLIPDQLIDRTRQRANSFFSNGIVAHIPFAYPFCNRLRRIVFNSANEVGAIVHWNGTYVVMEGPAFSTKAESLIHKGWGADVIGMTALPEAKLAREAEICYAIIACSTDYDAWHEEEQPVNVETILTTLKKNMEMSKKIVKLSIEKIGKTRKCECSSALSTAIVTQAELIPVEQKKRLEIIIRKYIKG